MNSHVRMPLISGVIAVITSLYISSFAFASDPRYNRASLRGFKGVYVSVEKLAPEIEANGLKGDRIQKDVVSKLRKVGIKTLSKEEWLRLNGSPSISVSILILKLRETKEYIYSTNTAFKQDVHSVREPMMILGASTWSARGRIGITSDLDKIRTSVTKQVDEFITAYKSVNPK
jgi:hypothetical protein